MERLKVFCWSHQQKCNDKREIIKTNALERDKERHRIIIQLKEIINDASIIRLSRESRRVEKSFPSISSSYFCWFSFLFSFFFFRGGSHFWRLFFQIKMGGSSGRKSNANSVINGNWAVSVQVGEVVRHFGNLWDLCDR